MFSAYLRPLSNRSVSLHGCSSDFVATVLRRQVAALYTYIFTGFMTCAHLKHNWEMKTSQFAVSIVWLLYMSLYFLWAFSRNVAKWNSVTRSTRLFRYKRSEEFIRPSREPSVHYRFQITNISWNLVEYNIVF